jgi:hypothetical protein
MKNNKVWKHFNQRRDTKVIHAAKYVKSSSEDFYREVYALFSLRKSSLILQVSVSLTCYGCNLGQQQNKLVHV